MDAELFLDARSRIGEGPVWEEATGRLVWVDIPGQAVHRTDPITGTDVVRLVGHDIGAAVPRAGGGLLLAAEDGFRALDDGTDRTQLWVAVEADDPTMRMNDGKCDAQGRFWAGTMDRDSAPGRGSLYRLDPDGALRTMVAGVSISNGLDWSLDGRTMYYIDSLTHHVDTFDFDPATGELGERRTLVTVDAADGDPDGMTVDADGYLWVALWNGSSVRRYTPDGRLDRTLRLPVAQVTSVCFGGPDLRDLYITSASENLTAEQRAEQPHAGSVFRARPGVTGRPANRFGG